jgi:hypothetical protein
MVLFSLPAAATTAATADNDDGVEHATASSSSTAATTLSAGKEQKKKVSRNMEMAWRHIKKPLISIGARGVVSSHANSLRDLMAAHTVVKVKIRHVDGLEAGFASLAMLLPDIELLHMRESDAVLLIGGKGARELIESGKFPPPPPAPTTWETDKAARTTR